MQELEMSMETMSKDIQSELGISDELADKMIRLEEGTLDLGKTTDFDMDFPIIKGHGEFSKDKKIPVRKHVTGSATITSPKNGTWHLVLKDGDPDQNPRIIFDKLDASYGIPIPFDHTFHKKIHLRGFADWSIKEDTKLTVHVEVHY
jgi:hypothetical protein